MLLMDYVRFYCATHDVAASTEEQYLRHVRGLCRDIGQIEVEYLTVQEVACHLRRMKLEGLADSYRRSRRNHLLALLRAASRDKTLPNRPAKIDRDDVPTVRILDYMPCGYTLAEATRLFEAAPHMKGTYRHGIKRAAFWRAWIPAAWDSGLSPCDMLAIRRRSISPEGHYQTVRMKTGTRVSIRFHPGTLALIDATFPPDRDYVFPLWGTIEALRLQFGRLRKLAGLDRGSLKWIRSGSGSDVELMHPGAGHTHLANTRAVFERHYKVESITENGRPRPRAIVG